MVMLREAMRLVADVLQQPQRRRVPAQAQRLRLAGAINLLLTLGERNQAWRLNAQQPKNVLGRVELPLAAVDEQDVGEYRLLLVVPRPAGGAESPRDDLANRGEV